MQIERITYTPAQGLKINGASILDDTGIYLITVDDYFNEAISKVVIRAERQPQPITSSSVRKWEIVSLNIDIDTYDLTYRDKMGNEYSHETFISDRETGIQNIVMGADGTLYYVGPQLQNSSNLCIALDATMLFDTASDKQFPFVEEDLTLQHSRYTLSYYDEFGAAPGTITAIQTYKPTDAEGADGINYTINTCALTVGQTAAFYGNEAPLAAGLGDSGRYSGEAFAGKFTIWGFSSDIYERAVRFVIAAPPGSKRIHY